MNDRKELDPEVAKSPWESPTIDEIDYAQTEAAYLNIGVADLGFYST